MPFLAILIGWLSLLIAIPFAGKLQGSVNADLHPDQSAVQIEAFARGAWHRAREVGPGIIDRSTMDLPAGFSDNPAWPLQAWSDGRYVYIWSGEPKRGSAGLSTVLFGDDSATTQVGISGSQNILWRDGSSSSRPSPVSNVGLVIRMNIT